MGIVERLRNNTHLGQPDWVEGLLEDAELAADLIERLKGYAEHQFICEWWRSEGVEEPSSGVCTCGLTALIKEIEGE